MKKVYILALGVLMAVSAFAQYSKSHQQPLELRKLQIAAPLKGNMFTMDQAIKTDAPDILFDSLNISYQSSWGFGQSFSISSSNDGNTLFIGSGSGVIILDVTNVNSPVKISELSTRGLVDAIYYDETAHRLYLTAYFAGFEIWDVSNMAAPVRIGGGETTGLPRGGIFASGNYVYVVTVADGVQVYDVTNPSAPFNSGNCQLDPNNFCWNSAKNGNLIYAALSEGGMSVVDVSDPLDPHVVGTYGGLTNGVCIGNGYAYTVSWDNFFHVLDISNLSSITEIGYCHVDGSPTRVQVKGNYAYIGNNTTNPGGGVNVVNVTTATAPVLGVTYAGFAANITANGNMVAFTGSGYACTILSIATPATPVLGNNYQIPNFTSDVYVNGNYAYTGNNGFRIFDISNKAHPVQVGIDTTDKNGSIVRTAGDKAVFIRESMTSNNPVMIMNIANPAQPTFLGQYMAPVMTNDLEIKDHYAFVGGWWDGFRVVDFQDPANPVLSAHKAGWFNGAVPGVDFCYVQALDIEGNYLYLIDYGPFAPTEDTRGLYIWDITDPTNPVFVSRYVDFTSYGYDIDAQGDFVYIADNYGGMEVIDVTDKLAPVTRGYISLPDGANSVKAVGNHVFVADYINGGVQAVNVTDPDNLVNDGYYEPSGCFALGVDVKGNYIYLADGAGGFQIYSTTLTTGIKDPGPASVTSSRAYPDPFTDHVTISVDKAEAGSLNIFDASGRLVVTLKSSGKVFQWDGKTASGTEVNAGFYFYSNGSVNGKILKAN